MNFKEYSKQAAIEIEAELSSITRTWDKNLKPFIESISGGKMLRGTLVKLGYELTKGSTNEAIIKPAAAYEILHTSFLIHDDIIDESPRRRGQPSLYKALGGNQHGISLAICYGDLGFFLANKLISESKFPAEQKIKASAIFSDISAKTILGEMLDIELSGSVTKEKDVLSIHRMKTAYYTVTGPLQIGAVLGGASEKMLRKMQIFGENLGTAFQIQDDILGVFGDEKTLGKSITSDIEEGKNTLLITYALQKANPEQKKFLANYYGLGKITQQKLKQIKKIFEDTRSLNYSQIKADEYIENGRKIIPLLTKDAKVQMLLNDLADVIIKRKK